MDMAKINQYYDTVLFSVYEVGFLRKFRVEEEHALRGTWKFEGYKILAFKKFGQISTFLVIKIEILHQK